MLESHLSKIVGIGILLPIRLKFVWSVALVWQYRVQETFLAYPCTLELQNGLSILRL